MGSAAALTHPPPRNEKSVEGDRRGWRSKTDPLASRRGAEELTGFIVKESGDSALFFAAPQQEPSLEKGEPLLSIGSKVKPETPAEG